MPKTFKEENDQQIIQTIQNYKHTAKLLTNYERFAQFLKFKWKL